MSDPVADFAVLGSTPLARLVAGLLAGTHGKTVLFVGEGQSGYRLPRGIDLSVAPITRPETWALLKAGTAETQRLVARIAGRGALNRVDPVVFAGSPRAREALSHVAHMAQGFGTASEPVVPSLLGQNRSGLILRDALRLNRAVLEPATEKWLADQGVRREIPERVSVRADGSVILHVGGKAVNARQAILADDAAILAHLPLPQWPPLLRRRTTSSILTTPTKPLLSPIMLEVDTGTLLMQQPEGGIAGTGPDDLATFSLRMQALLGRERQVQQAGQTSFTALITLDGAPALGRVGSVGADIVAGLGSIGAFLAPALARWMAGAATSSEAAWFAARLISRNGRTLPVSEYVPDEGQAQ
jgi:hypothetical protein